jgi:hypothetical protein
LKEQQATVAWTGAGFITLLLVSWYHLSQPLSVVTITYIDPILSCCYTEAQDTIINTKHLAFLGFFTFTLCKEKKGKKTYKSYTLQK